MSGQYSPNKRQREAEQARRRQEKEQQRALRRERGPGHVEIVDASSMHGNLPSIEEALDAIGNRGHQDRSAAGIPVRLFVGGLPDDTTEQELRAVFEQFGTIADAIIMRDRTTRAPRGFGFVTMSNRREAMKAIEALEGAPFKHRTLAVNIATDRGR